MPWHKLDYEIFFLFFPHNAMMTNIIYYCFWFCCYSVFETDCYDSFWKYASGIIYLSMIYTDAIHISEDLAISFKSLSIYWPTSSVYWQHLLCLPLCSDLVFVIYTSHSVQFYNVISYTVSVGCFFVAALFTMCSY